MPRGGGTPKPTIKKLYDERQAAAEAKVRPSSLRKNYLGEPPEPERKGPGTARRSNKQEQRTTLEGLMKIHEFPKLNFSKGRGKGDDVQGVARNADDAAGGGVANYHRLLEHSLCKSPKRARTICFLLAAQKPNLEIVSKVALVLQGGREINATVAAEGIAEIFARPALSARRCECDEVPA